MEILKEFDNVLLKDGRIVAITDICGDQELFHVDIGTCEEDWDCDTVTRDQIVKVIK